MTISAQLPGRDGGRLSDRLVALVLLRLVAAGFRPPVPGFDGEGADVQARLVETADGMMAMLAEAALHADDSLVRVAHAYGLSALELELLAFALAPHCDERIGTVFQSLAPGFRRLTVADALGLAVGRDTDRMTLRRHLQGSSLWRLGLLIPDTADLFERRLIASPALPLALQPPAWDQSVVCGAARVRLRDCGTWTAPRDRRDAQADELGRRFAERPFRGLVLDAPAPHHARALAEALARRLGLPLLDLRPVGQGVEDLFEIACILAAAWGVVPLVDVRDARADVRMPDAPALGVPVLVSAPLGGRLISESGDGDIVTVRPVRPTTREREASWLSLLDAPVDAAIGEAIACLALQDVPVETMRRCLDEARTLAGPKAPLTAEHVNRAFLGIQALPPTAFGQAVHPAVLWSALVLDGKTAALLEDVVRRVRHRARVYEDWEMDAPRTSGVVTLLHGEAGTGKTHAVEAIATRLAMPLLRVDLSTVVSKYIGETEKHLAELFEAAQGFRAILFFDEADALFARRTGVSDSHDRYANLETNYLLQRLEAFDQGIVFLATNLKRNMDDAFVRRIGVSIHVPRPTPLEQMALWALHVPEVARGDALDFGLIVERYDLVGGEIRNCALTAGFSAAADGGRITMHHLERAIAQELEKMGRPVPHSAGTIAPFPLRTTSQAQAGRSSCRH